MARAEYGNPELRATVPTLEPDDAFLARLSELAAGSGASRPPAAVPSLPGWRVGLAAASVAAVVGGLAWLAAAVSGDESPPPSPTPVTQPTDPSPTGAKQDLPAGGRDSGAGRDENEGPGGSRDPGGLTGGSVGSAPGGGPNPAGDPGRPGGDEPGDDQGDGQGDEQGGGAPGDQGQGQNPTPGGPGNGQAGEDHGPQDGHGDEVHGQDGQPHGQAGQDHGTPKDDGGG